MICDNCGSPIVTKQLHRDLPGGRYAHDLEADCLVVDEKKLEVSHYGECKVCRKVVLTDDNFVRVGPGPAEGTYHSACWDAKDFETLIPDESRENTESTGGTRYSAGKPGHWWCAPLLGLKLVAPVWTRGAEKYAPMDWQEGQSFSTLIDCAMRHMLDMLHYGPLARCKESGNYHAAHLVWNLLALLTFIEEGREKEMNDVDKWRGVTAAMAKRLRAAADKLEETDGSE